jgi:hypothetical protein
LLQSGWSMQAQSKSKGKEREGKGRSKGKLIASFVFFVFLFFLAKFFFKVARNMCFLAFLVAKFEKSK